ncbi:MAG: NUDIX domain-containing protein [Bacteroidales bacterium]|nr:NUDIX domain-containing protein [Bacteroidales bacterium]
MTEVKFYDPDDIGAGKLIYTIIPAVYEGRWIFVRHRDRDTWEIAGGHIEKGESPDEAAERELAEETGAQEFRLHSISTYSVTKDGSTEYGRLYLAEVTGLGPIKDVTEIAEIRLTDHLPGNLTYPDIQPVLFRRAVDYL